MHQNAIKITKFYYRNWRLFLNLLVKLPQNKKNESTTESCFFLRQCSISPTWERIKNCKSTHISHGSKCDQNYKAILQEQSSSWYKTRCSAGVYEAVLKVMQRKKIKRFVFKSKKGNAILFVNINNRARVNRLGFNYYRECTVWQKYLRSNRI